MHAGVFFAKILGGGSLAGPSGKSELFEPPLPAHPVSTDDGPGHAIADERGGTLNSPLLSLIHWTKRGEVRLDVFHLYASEDFITV